MTQLTPQEASKEPSREAAKEAPRKRRRLLPAALVAAALLIAVAFAVWPYLVPTAWIEGGAQAVLAGAVERPVSIGSVRVTRLGHIRLDDVVVWRDLEKTSPLVRWQSFDLAVKLLPLLGGRVAVERVTLLQPEVFIPLTEEGRPDLKLPSGGGPAGLGLLVGEATVRQGTITLLNPDSTPRLIVRDINLEGDLDGLLGPLKFKLDFTAPDSTDRTKVGIEGALSLSREAPALAWDALRGSLRLKLEGFDWEGSAAPPELREAVASLPLGMVRGADLDVTVRRPEDGPLEVEGDVAVEHLLVKGAREGEAVELKGAALSVAGTYALATQAAELKRLHFTSPWMEADFVGKLQRTGATFAVDGVTRGRLAAEGLPRAARQALAAQGVVLEGSAGWEALLQSGPAGSVVTGSLGLEKTGLQVAGLPLLAQGEPARLVFDLERAGEPWTIHRIEVETPEGTTQLVGKVLWRPPDQTSVDLKVTSRARTEKLAERWYALHPEAPKSLAVDGEVAAEMTVRGLLGGLTLSGSLDARQALVALDGVDIKGRGEEATLKADLDLKKNTLLVRQAVAKLPMAAVSLKGKLPLEAARPRYDLSAAVSLDLDDLQRRLSGKALKLPAGLALSGSAKAKVSLNRFQQTLGLVAEIDATETAFAWGDKGAKAKGVPARFKLSSHLDKGVEVDELTARVGPAHLSLAGRLDESWKNASLRYDGSVGDMAGLAALWKPLAEKKPKGFVAARGTLELKEGRPSLYGSMEFKKASFAMSGEPALAIGLDGSVSHSPTSLSAERLLLTVDKGPVLITAAVERKKDSGLEVLCVADAGRVDLTDLIKRLEGKPSKDEASKKAAPGEAASGEVAAKAEAEPSPTWGAALYEALRGGAKLHGRLRAEELTIEPYRLKDLALETTASGGVVKVPQFDFGLNGGRAAQTITADLKGAEPALEVALDWKGLGADPNLRPFLDKVLPNLFVTGSMDFSARWKTRGGEWARMGENLEGASTMVVYGGYMESAKTPEETQEVFPTLTMHHYEFERADIESRVTGGKSYNTMRFQAPSADLQITGWTDNKTGQIDYVMTVDLVENMGLGTSRDKIPDVLKSASRIEIAYVKGTIDDQRVEYLAPKVAKIKDTMKSLLGLQTVQDLLVGMSSEERKQYEQGKVGGLLGAAAKPFRYLGRKLKEN